jgi:integrase/recombinase XerD
MNGTTMAQLGDSWVIAMTAARTSPNTIRSYSTSIRLYLAWCAERGVADGVELPENVRAWLAHLAARVAAPAAARTLNVRLSALRKFAAWCVTETELDHSDLDRVAWARDDDTIPDYVSAGQLAALLATCGTRSFFDVRDKALMSLMYDGLLRADETLSIRAKGDLDLKRRAVHVVRGKGGKERWSGFSPQAARHLDVYQRARGKHRHALAEAYWIGKYGPLTYKGIWTIYAKRGRLAGIEGLHPHATRAGGAVAWRLAKGSTEGLMTIAGWDSLEMVRHYTRAAEIEIALAEQQQLFGKR